jgi:hypothetical protein
MSFFIYARAFLFVIALFQQAGAAEAVSLAGGLDGIHRALLVVTIDRPPMHIDEFRGLRDLTIDVAAIQRSGPR